MTSICHSDAPRENRAGLRGREAEGGFALVAVIVAIFLVLLALSVAAPKVARALRRDREVETGRRAQQYVRAVRLYYKKLGHYPASMEQLEKTNNVRYLRQRWVDPMTGKDDWRLIHVGEQKTSVKGFFGQPLAGIASGGLGSAAGLASAGGAGAPAGATGLGTGLGSAAGAGGLGTSSGLGSGASGSGFSLGPSGVSVSSGATGSGATGTSAATSAAGGGDATSPGGVPGTGLGSGLGSGLGGSSSSDSSGSGGPFVGVGVPKDGESIMTVNEKTAYKEWEFWYDPRIEQLLQRANLLGGGGTSGGGLGSAAGSQSGFGSGLSSPGGFGGTGAAGAATPPAGNPTPPPASTQPQP